MGRLDWDDLSIGSMEGKEIIATKRRKARLRKGKNNRIRARSVPFRTQPNPTDSSQPVMTKHPKTSYQGE